MTITDIYPTCPQPVLNNASTRGNLLLWCCSSHIQFLSDLHPAGFSTFLSLLLVRVAPCTEYVENFSHICNLFQKFLLCCVLLTWTVSYMPQHCPQFPAALLHLTHSRKLPEHVHKYTHNEPSVWTEGFICIFICSAKISLKVSCPGVLRGHVWS